MTNEVSQAVSRIVIHERASWSEAERRVMALVDLAGEVNNGGFHQYFLNTSGDLCPTALLAARDLGISAVADLLEQAMGRLAGGSDFPVDRVDRFPLLEAAGRSAFDDLDRRFWSLPGDEAIDDGLAVFVASGALRAETAEDPAGGPSSAGRRTVLLGLDAELGPTGIAALLQVLELTTDVELLTFGRDHVIVLVAIDDDGGAVARAVELVGSAGVAVTEATVER